MRCERAVEELSAYIEGEAPAGIRMELDGHMAECPSCRAEADALRRVWTAFESAPVVEPPPGLRSEVWRRIDAEPREARSRHRFAWRGFLTRRLMAVGLAALVVIVLARTVSPNGSSRAGFNWFGELLGGSRARQTVAVDGAPSYDAGSRTIHATILNRSKSPLAVTVSVGGGETPETVEVPGSGTAACTLHLAQDQKPTSIRLAWREGGAVKSLVQRMP